MPVLAMTVNRRDRILWVNRHLQEVNQLSSARLVGACWRKTWQPTAVILAQHKAAWTAAEATTHVGHYASANLKNGEPWVFLTTRMRIARNEMLVTSIDMTASWELAVLRSIATQTLKNPLAMLQRLGVGVGELTDDVALDHHATPPPAERPLRVVRSAETGERRRAVSRT